LPLEFPAVWRFRPPKDDRWNTETIPDSALESFRELIGRITTQGDVQLVLEVFKGHFCRVNGELHVWSSNQSWAHSDLVTKMREAASNAPLFLEAFNDACEELTREGTDRVAPDFGLVNDICIANDIGYLIDPPRLVARGSSAADVTVPPAPPTLGQEASQLLGASIRRADELLAQGRGREAVQESLWLLESATTAFRGIQTEGGIIRGKYFNQIVEDLRHKAPGPTLDRVSEWATNLHGYLSSPTGGGVRHGMDLATPRELTITEARLFCNLARSYLSFLLDEFARLRS